MNTNQLMKNVRSLAKNSGLSLQALGLKMGYHQNSARQSAAQFLKAQNPTVSVLLRFANAMNTNIEQLLQTDDTCETRERG